MTNIYVITNILSGKQYVGKTIKSVEQRFYEHCKLGSPKNMYIDAAIQKYGSENFRVDKLFECSDDTWKYWEAHFIELLRTHYSQGGYNLSKGGDNNPMDDPLVRKHHKLACSSEEHKEKLRKASTGRRHSESSRIKMGQIQRVVQNDPDVKRKVRNNQPTVIPVIMLDENDNPIRSFDSLSLVCQYFNKDVGNTSSLSKVIDKYNKNGKRSKFWGHAWIRKNSEGVSTSSSERRVEDELPLKEVEDVNH